MANENEKNPGNVRGPFYVDATCIDCDLCRQLAPASFRRNDDIGLSIVFRQPATGDEWAQAREAVESCPSDSIGEAAQRRATGH